MSIRVNQLLKTYGEQKAVNNISFEIRKGEIVGFLGPNGAGKSTTMKIITGYLQADAGSAEVCGINVKDKPLDVKKKIGYLPESNALYYEMYVKEYLGFIASVHHLPDHKKKIDDAIKLTGLTIEQKKKIGQLSKGYKQRVGLAAALVHNPDVLILDEPTSGLDPNQIIEIREVIKNEGNNKTVLFSSHILQEVEAICDRVIIINKGQIVADDRLTNLQKGRSDQHYILVQFKEAVNVELLKAIKEVTEVQQLSTSNADARGLHPDRLQPRRDFKLQTSNADAVRKQILQLALQHNLNIVSLQDESQTLEEIFRELTGEPMK